MDDCQKLFDTYYALKAEGNVGYDIFFQSSDLQHLIEANKLLAAAESNLQDSVRCYQESLGKDNEKISALFRSELEMIISDSPNKKDIPFLIQFGNENGNIAFLQEHFYKLANFLLSVMPLNVHAEAYLEQIIELLDDKTEHLIPIQILKRALLATVEGEAQYGAFIKAIWAIRKHDDKIVKGVLGDVRQTARYKNDEYIREWVD